MRIFVTGGTGYFGASLRPFLEGHEVVWQSRRVEPYWPKRDFDWLFDMNPAGNIWKTIDWAREHVSRVLYTSSGAVYGNEYLSSPDDSPRGPKTDYGRKKLESERRWLIMSGLPVVIARAFAFVGPELPQEPYAVGNFLRDALNGGPIVVKGCSTRSYMYSSDLGEWLFSLMERGEAGQAYNVGSEEAITTPQLAALVRDIVDPRMELVLGSESGTVYVPSTAKARALGLSIKVPLREALERTVAALKSRRRNAKDSLLAL
jgi:dTDP-glucose 4,6-dehydratase